MILSLVMLLAKEPARQPELPRLPFDAEKAIAIRREWAKALDVEEDFTNSIGMKLVLIPGGRFEMGPNGSRYRVTLSKAYHIGTTEVTLGQYRRFRPGHRIEGAEDAFNADDRPAAMVSWNDAREFCAWLSERPEEKKAGRIYTLPTEAQWEWAARAGTTTTRYFGDSDKDQAKYSWFNVTYTPNPKHESDGRGR
jgi:formylglycine-generating enzyme required for sulfatase activity